MIFKHTTLFIKALFLSMVLYLSACNSTDQAYDLQFYTNEYPPFNYSEEGKLIGLGPDLVYRIAEELDFTPYILVGNWTESYQACLDDEQGVLFSAVLNADRKDLFKWAGPYAEVEWNFYKKVGSSWDIVTLEDAKQVGSIGVLEDNTMHQYLVQQGFSNLVFCEDQEDAVSKLLEGSIDLYPATEIPMKSTLVNLGSSFYHVEKELHLLSELIYFAFNPAVPDEVVADFQEKIDDLKRTGFITSLTETYFNHRNVPDVLMIYTEDYAPLSFRNEQGEISGFGTDLVREILSRRGEFYNIQLTSWSNAYQLASLNRNVCLYTMERTTARENLFQWVGPIGSNTSFFYTRTGSGIELESIEDAKQLAHVGVVENWFSTQTLIEEGFTNLTTVSTPEELVHLLMNNEVDAVVITNITFPAILENLQYAYSDVEENLELMSTDFYISFSKETSTVIVEEWQESLNAIKADGTFQFIHDKWLH